MNIKRHQFKKTHVFLKTGRIIKLTNDTILISRDGKERKIANSAAPICSDNKKIFGVVLVFRDVTQEYAMREQILHMQKMEAIGQLAGGIAHDFNNLLTTIMGNIELLEVGMTFKGENKKKIATINKALDRAADMTEKLLGFARKGKQNQQLVKMHNTIQEVVELLRRSINPNIVIQLNLNASQDVIKCDPTQLHNTILNLAINAQDAMPNGGILFFKTVVVTIDKIKSQELKPNIQPGIYIEFILRDTGMGMDKTTLKPIGKGTGLGLASVYGLVQSLKGAIDVSSILHKGTSVRIYLPIKKVYKTKIRPVKDKAKSIVVSKGKGHILIGEDDKNVKDYVKMALKKSGYQVSHCWNGWEAVEWYKEHGQTEDLILMDERMPILSGRETFKKLKKMNPDVKVIIMTGYTKDGIISKLLHAGVLDYIYKPFSIAKLSHKIAKYIN